MHSLSAGYGSCCTWQAMVLKSLVALSAVNCLAEPSASRSGVPCKIMDRWSVTVSSGRVDAKSQQGAPMRTLSGTEEDRHFSCL